jgi:FkbM family methyltransferase
MAQQQPPPCTYDVHEKGYRTALKRTYDNNNRTLQKYLLPATFREHYATRGLFEGSLIQWCAQFGDPQKLMLDIGAHTGTYGITLAHKFKQVVFFEPQKSTFFALCGSIALSGPAMIQQVEAHRVGLGAPDQVGEQTLYIPSVDGGGSSVVNSAGALGAEKVEIRTLDSFGFGDRVGFIKMDIEGNELNCLRGATETIRLSRPRILFEANSSAELTPVAAYLTDELSYKVTPIAGYSNMYIAE